MTEEYFEEPKRPYTDYRNPKFNIISIVAYLIGVDRKHFEPEHSSPQMETYERLEGNKSARLIRNLCRIRTALLRNYSAVTSEFRYGIANIGSLPELIPKDALNQLNTDGIELYMMRPDVNEYVVEINTEISNRIGNVKGLFPEWLNWTT